jgi:hypothetical protein
MAPREKQFLPQAVAEIPWGHNITLLEKVKDSAKRIWYARQATTQLVESLPAKFKGSLPSPKELEAELRSGERKAN